jgi:L,D-peptidoglycan transpeptidase YkuD (ErfK/YbiS/YcfS/YnhG family)
LTLPECCCLTVYSYGENFMKIRMIAGFATAWMGIAAVSPAAGQQPGTCPAFMNDATTLFLVLTPTLGAKTATVSHFERSSPKAPWKKSGASRLATVGSAGLGWSFAFEADAGRGEPIKQEGDKRTPAGLFKLSDSFGRGPVGGSGVRHLDLTQGDPICVDDLNSADYGRIADRSQLTPGAKGEVMAKEALYRRGLVIETPVDRAKRSGSCIFFHVWRGPDRPTVGCVALAENDVAYLQRAAKPGAVVAILPRTALFRYSACLPGSAD